MEIVAGSGSVAIDGRPLGSARLWAPLPGYHPVTLSDGDQRRDATRFTVR